METLSYPKNTKAKKEHKCNWCLLPIGKGSIYQKSSHKDEGEIYTWKNHIHCSEVLDKIGVWDDGDGIDEDSFREYITNEYSKISEIYDYRKFPKFAERLDVVLDYYKISTN